MTKGKFQLLYIEDGIAYPAYPKDEIQGGLVDDMAKMGMFGEEIAVNRDQPLGRVKGSDSCEN